MSQYVAAREASRARRQLEAAQLLYEDRENDEAIAARLGICRRTLAYWKHHPAVIARLAELQEEGWARSRANLGLPT